MEYEIRIERRVPHRRLVTRTSLCLTGAISLASCNGAHVEGPAALIIGIPLMLLFLYLASQVGDFLSNLWSRLTGRPRAPESNFTGDSTSSYDPRTGSSDAYTGSGSESSSESDSGSSSDAGSDSSSSSGDG